MTDLLPASIDVTDARGATVPLQIVRHEGDEQTVYVLEAHRDYECPYRGAGASRAVFSSLSAARKWVAERWSAGTDSVDLHDLVASDYHWQVGDGGLGANYDRLILYERPLLD